MYNRKNYISKKIIAILIFVTIILFSNVAMANSFYEFKGLSLIPAEEFISSDISNLKKLTNINEVYREIHELNTLEQKLLSNYIPTHSGVKLYGPEITEQIHAVNGALYYRWKLVDSGIGSEVSFDKQKYFADNPFTEMRIIDRSSRDEVDIALMEAKRVLNYINIDNQYTQNVRMFISPYHLEGALGFAHRFINTKGELIKTAVIGGRLNNVVEEYSDNYYSRPTIRANETVRKGFRATVLHELGHTIDYGLKETNKDFKNAYNAIYPDMKFNSGAAWATRGSENFAEDFKVFFSDKLGRMSSKIEHKKTLFKYDERVDELFKELLKEEV